MKPVKAPEQKTTSENNILELDTVKSQIQRLEKQQILDNENQILNMIIITMKKKKEEKKDAFKMLHRRK